MLLGNTLRGRNNNFDLIRFFAALLVIFAHAFPISLGSENKEPLMIISGGQADFGDLAVFVFFITSGFLITMSYDKSKSLLSYANGRVLRIFPALIAVVFISVFLLGPIVTTYSTNQYFNDAETYGYLSYIFLYPILGSEFLPGVFTDSPYPNTINSSLWTLKYEVICYIIIAILGKLGLLKQKILIPILIISVVFVSFSPPLPLFILWIPTLFNYFAIGALFYLNRNKIVLSGKIAFVSLLLLIVSVFWGQLKLVFLIFGAYLVFYIAFSSKIKFHRFGKFGDFSYGLYLYAFPIQQTIIWLFGKGMNPYLNFLISFPVTFILSIMSWYLIEKPSLNLKSKLNRSLNISSSHNKINNQKSY